VCEKNRKAPAFKPQLITLIINAVHLSPI